MSGLGHVWAHLWYGPVDRLRLWCLEKVILVVLALDCWMLMAERGGRYGAGGFNVAHFGWIDALMPTPTPGLYLGLIFSCGWLAALVASGVMRRAGLMALTVLYTYAWAMSQLDSYQHHYFLSWVLLCLCFFPLGRHPVCHDKTQGDPHWGPSPVSCFGYRLLCAQLVILYLYTGLSKTEPQWISGSVVQRINQDSGALQPFLDLFVSWGGSPEQFWGLTGLGVVCAQGLIALLWLSVLLVGERRSRLLSTLRACGVLVALGFHLGAEVAGLRIGWFGGYMIALTLIAFTPTGWFHALGGRLVNLSRSLADRGASPLVGAPVSNVVWGTLSLAVLLALLCCHHELELPGVSSVGLCVALWLGLRLIWARVTRRGPGRYAELLSCMVWLAILTTGLSTTTVRYDFYRFLGGDCWRRQEVQSSLSAYGKANSYAPEGQGRHKKVREIMGRLPLR